MISYRKYHSGTDIFRIINGKEALVVTKDETENFKRVFWTTNLKIIQEALSEECGCDCSVEEFEEAFNQTKNHVSQRRP